MLNRFQYTICIPGAMAGAFASRFVVPSDCSLVHISAYCITQDSAIIIGSTSDTNLYLESQTITAGTALEIERTDFVDDVFPHFENGDTVVITLDNGSGAVDMTCVLTFTEG